MEIIHKSKFNIKKTLLLGLVLFVFLSFLPQLESFGYSRYIFAGEMDYFYVKDLDTGVNYNFTVISDDILDTLDVGFIIYEKYDCKNDSLIIEVDTIGDSTESTILTATKKIYYIGVYSNDESGFVDVTCKEQDTGVQIDVLTHFTDIRPFTFEWWWILLITLPLMFLIIFIPLFVLLTLRKKKMFTLDSEGIVNQQISHAAVKKKVRKCQYCKAGITDDTLFKCPNCGAIIEED
ncbi:MAG: hypothetical protein ACFFDW_15060 [Candidatus Thorarchaeota archaeon]